VPKDACALLFANGPIFYPMRNADPIEEEYLQPLLGALKHLFQKAPRGNGKYYMFVRTNMVLMADGTYGTIAALPCFIAKRKWFLKRIFNKA
jgi:hypothetical protein